ncbi:MAG: hypothetical protein WBZ36_21480 [Candidatus Nitrosopolaris sp.]
MGIDGNLTNNENEEKYTHPQYPQYQEVEKQYGAKEGIFEM